MEVLNCKSCHMPPVIDKDIVTENLRGVCGNDDCINPIKTKWYKTILSVAKNWNRLNSVPHGMD